MILVWRGWGIVVPAIAFVSFLLTQLAFDSVFGQGFYTAYTLPKLFACLPASAALWLIGSRVNREFYTIDQATGKPFVRQGNHSFFFIKIEYWAIALPVFMIALFVFGR